MNEIQRQVAAIQKSAATNPRFKPDQKFKMTKEHADDINKLFNTILPHFPAWRQSCPTELDLQRLKVAWAKAFARLDGDGKELNIKAGLIACEQSDTDWLPSVGKFIKWCEQSENKGEFANRALGLFNNGQRQIDSVGKLVVSKHKFELKIMRATESNKKFIELYLHYAENNAIEMLDAALLSEKVQLSREQQKDADNRAEAARNRFLNEFSDPSLIKQAKSDKKDVKTGLKTGSLKTRVKSQHEINESRRIQLEAIKGKLNE